MIFQVLTNPALTANAMKAGNRRAAERQTQLEHDALLDIRSLPGYNAILRLAPGPQRMLAEAALRAQADARERAEIKYWDDEHPRGFLTQSSSWVGNVDYDPYSQVMNVNLGGKTYTYPNVSPEGVAKFLNSESLGKFLNKLKPYNGQGF
jgi:hypothetical protein